MFESRISAEANEQYQGGESLTPRRLRGPTTWKGMLKKMRWEILRTGTQKKRESNYTKISSPCLDDHRFKKQLEQIGELSEVCCQIVLKCMYLARISRPDVLWSVNKLARPVTQWTRACDRRSARLISHIHHTSDHRQYCHVGTTAQHCRLGFFSKTPIFLVTLRIQTQPRWEFYVSLEVEHLFLWVGCVRNKRQYLTILQNQKSFRWMLDCEWMDYFLLIYGTWW